MGEFTLRMSHIMVRIIASITLACFAVVVISDRYYPQYSHALANSGFGKIVCGWTIATSLLLPLYVGFEGWWFRKMRESIGGDLALDAMLAIACFASLIVIALYELTHYAMF